MSDERATQAIARIERVLARIEEAATRTPELAPRDDSDLRQLREVHQALRGKVEGAISQIDRLLAGAERV
jgi:C4-type Zn-finger protein